MCTQYKYIYITHKHRIHLFILFYFFFYSTRVQGRPDHMVGKQKASSFHLEKKNTRTVTQVRIIDTIYNIRIYLIA